MNLNSITKYMQAAGIVLALAFGVFASLRTLPRDDKPTPAPEPKPTPLVEPTDERPLILPAEVTIPDRGFIKLPLKTIGAIRVVEYPGTAKVLQVEQFGADVLLSRRSQVAEDVYLGLQCEHKGVVGSVQWVLCKLNLAPLPPPTPEPEPAPKPDPKPEPPAPPAPIVGDGLRVLIVYESADLSKMPASQVSMLQSKQLLDYLDTNCPIGDDGKLREWRIWDKDVPTSNVSKTWREAMLRPRASLPWIVISNGKTGFEGPLPKTLPETMNLLKKWGGK